MNTFSPAIDEPLNILVVDDHDGLRAEISAMLVEQGHAVYEAASVAHAIPLVQSQVFDFILLDYRMPYQDGLWFLRNVDIPRETRVLLMTAHNHNDLITAMFKAGARGYLIKPFAREDLMHHLTFHANIGRKMRRN
jgi:CheY-like chemotaxis protein